MVPVAAPHSSEIEKVLLTGDLSRLTPEQRLSYYNNVCESLRLNPLTKPFAYLTLNGKTVLYATKDCTEQLRSLHAISLQIIQREVTEGCYVVTARAVRVDGRTDESIGAVPIESLKGEARSNAMMKCETKAKRRVTLSICGLGMLDESEVGSIPGAHFDEPERGTRDAQKEVASRKIHELTAAPPELQPSPFLADLQRKVDHETNMTQAFTEERNYEQRHAAKVSEAAEALKPEPKPARKRGTITFEALGKFKELKADLGKLTGEDRAYYDALSCAGVSHADELDTEPARKVFKALAKILTAKRQEAELQNTFTEYTEQLGVHVFTQILGNHGCENVTNALGLNGTPLSALLGDLRQAAADRVTA